MVRLNVSVGTFPAGSDVTFSPQAEADLVKSGKAAYLQVSPAAAPAPHPAPPAVQPAQPAAAPVPPEQSKPAPVSDFSQERE